MLKYTSLQGHYILQCDQKKTLMILKFRTRQQTVVSTQSHVLVITYCNFLQHIHRTSLFQLMLTSLKTESGHGVRWVHLRVLETIYRSYHLKAYGLGMLDLLVMAWIEVGEKTESGHGVWWVCSRVFNTLYRGYHLKAYGLVMLDLLMIVG